MERIDPDLRRLIEAAAEQGVGMEDIEHELLDRADLPADEYSALWLYALARRDMPHRKTVPLVSG